MNTKGGSMQNLNAVDLVSYNQSNNQLKAGGNCIDFPYYWDTHNYYCHTWYPSICVPEKSKIEQAFKIVGKLLDGKLIEKELTVKTFMKLVNDIAEIL
jgi:hypothetical protein